MSGCILAMILFSFKLVLCFTCYAEFSAAIVDICIDWLFLHNIGMCVNRIIQDIGIRVGTKAQ